MMQNNELNKKRFFAQYWGQKVGTERVSSEGDGFERNYIIDNNTIVDIKYDFLELTPLSKLKKEDIEWDIKYKRYFRPHAAYEDLISEIELASYCGFLEYCVVDYLRNKGYALRWHNLPIEEQVKRGWIKLL